jgi:hypothetical protein
MTLNKSVLRQILNIRKGYHMSKSTVNGINDFEHNQNCSNDLISKDGNRGMCLRFCWRNFYRDH